VEIVGAPEKSIIILGIPCDSINAAIPILATSNAVSVVVVALFTLKNLFIVIFLIIDFM
jgi:hypothetical protein